MASPLDASLDYQDEASQVAAIQSLGAELEALDDFPFAAVLLDVQASLVKTKAGLAPADSPLTYQQSDRPHDFKTWMSSTIAPGAGTSCAVPRLALFTGAVQHTFPDVLTADEPQILMVMLEEAKTKPHKYEEQLILHCQLLPSASASFDASIPQNVTPILSRIDVSHQCQEVPLLLEDFTFLFTSVYFIALCGNHTLKTFHFTDRLAIS
ncbi:hypothetical protein HPB49_008486 [Dermacentor silvarum]|uniref:Uncharacterized protein n=1 Tax=Dermacentor silvarum TaxID=543639 RepID=A0ACB8DBS8_DERSI|nr:hypothetical protein HPB49_008486 [Dermacentor silvarum]